MLKNHICQEIPIFCLGQCDDTHSHVARHQEPSARLAQQLHTVSAGEHERGGLVPAETRQRPGLLLELLARGLGRRYIRALDRHADNTHGIAIFLSQLPMNASLYEKYRVPPTYSTTRFSTLSFVLRKAEMAIALTAAEWQWLEKQQLSVAIDVISAQEAYRSALAEKIRLEILDLRRNRLLSSRINAVPSLTADSETALILYKVHNLELLDQVEERFVDSSYAAVREFNQLKTQLDLTEDIPCEMTSRRILLQLSEGQVLASNDLEWLRQKHIVSVVKCLAMHFGTLCQTHGINASELPAEDRLQLQIILQKLEEQTLPDEHEQRYLQQHGFLTVSAVCRKIEFSSLKAKYQAAQMAEDSPNTHLYVVLKRIDADLPLAEADLNYLRKRKLNDTIVLAVERHAERLMAKVEQGLELTPEDVVWCQGNQSEKVLLLSLKKFFGVEHRQDTVESPLYRILQKLKTEQRLNDQEVVWLTTEGWCGRRHHMWSPSQLSTRNERNKIYVSCYRLEALFCEAEFKRTKNFWLLASSSAHWRRAEEPERSLSLTELDLSRIAEAKLKQALLTTRGGALRDLDRLGEAEECALQAIQYYPHSHNPYTLMGALCYDTRRYEEGTRWFEEARKRGATENDEDAEIKRILRKRNDPELKKYLLKKDPDRYAWIRKLQPAKGK